MKHVSTFNSRLQAKLRTVIVLHVGCAHLGSHMAYNVFAVVFLFVHKVNFIYYSIKCGVKYVA